MEEYRDALASIERAVEEGDGDLSGLGFWPLVGKVKVDPALSEHWADDIGRIDRKAFERRVRPTFPVWVGNSALVAAAAVLVGAVPVAVALARRPGAAVVAGLMVVAAGGGIGSALHGPAHWLVGRLAGIRFLRYYFDGPLRVQPGLKIDYASYLRASPSDRAWMHAAGAVVTKVAPFAVFAAAYLPHRASGYALLPAWSLWAVLGIGALQLLTDALFSTRSGDWMKVRRELRAEAARRAEAL